ncbi:MAG: glycosyltransferase family 2 protein [Deltaproteobacteria bacterium]
MDSNQILTVVIPALNEAAGIARVVSAIPREVGKYRVEVLVVNDGSADDTAHRASEAGARVISHPVNRGYGAALKTGFANARGDLLAFLDADFTYPPDELPKMVRELETGDFDIVVGSRIAGGAEGMPAVRFFGNRVMAEIVSALTRSRITDPASGMRVFKKGAIESLYPLSDDLDFTPEMTTKAIQQKLKYGEVPINYRERVGTSKLSVFKHGYIFLATILRTVRDHNPLLIFGSAGIISLFIGILLCLFVVISFLAGGSEHQYSLIFGILAVFLGVQLILFGSLADMILVHLRRLKGK